MLVKRKRGVSPKRPSLVGFKSKKSIARKEKKSQGEFSSLDNTYVSRRSLSHKAVQASFRKLKLLNPDEYKEMKVKRRRGRFWNRAKTGEHILRSQKKKGWSFKMLTLTSSYESGNLSRDFEIFLKRLKRFWHLRDIPYIKTVEWNKKGDLLHLHIIMYTPYVSIEKIRHIWNEIHHAYEVFIERIKDVDDELNKQFGYIGKYISKDMAKRFSYSRSWLGFLTNVPLLWKAAVEYYFELKISDLEWLLRVWSEFIDGIMSGEIPKRFDNLYDFMVLSTW